MVGYHFYLDPFLAVFQIDSFGPPFALRWKVTILLAYNHGAPRTRPVYILCADYATGLDRANLKHWATMADRKAKKPSSTSAGRLANEELPARITIDGKLNMFGSGSKSAGFGLGHRVIVLTKVTEDPLTRAVTMSVKQYEDKRVAGEDQYTFAVLSDKDPEEAFRKALTHAQPDAYPKTAEERSTFADALKSAKGLSDGKLTFTLFFVLDILSDEDKSKCVDLELDQFPGVAGTLRNAYHYYLGSENCLPYDLDIELGRRRTTDEGPPFRISLREPELEALEALSSADVRSSKKTCDSSFVGSAMPIVPLLHASCHCSSPSSALGNS